jgi:hypothetical protein
MAAHGRWEQSSLESIQPDGKPCGHMGRGPQALRAGRNTGMDGPERSPAQQRRRPARRNNDSRQSIGQVGPSADTSARGGSCPSSRCGQHGHSDPLSFRRLGEVQATAVVSHTTRPVRWRSMRISKAVVEMVMTRSSHRALCTCSPTSFSAGGEMVLSELIPSTCNCRIDRPTNCSASKSLITLGV